MSWKAGRPESLPVVLGSGSCVVCLDQGRGHVGTSSYCGAIDPYIWQGDRAFLKINMRHGVYWHEKEYHRNDMNLFVNSTGDIRLFWNRHGSCKNNDRGHCHFLKSTCDFRDPPSRAPTVGEGWPFLLRDQTTHRQRPTLWTGRLICTYRDTRHDMEIFSAIGSKPNFILTVL